ncbi:ABA4-like family protein [Streptomyces sp. NPDC004111]|uniref:ABA4-like family protein n=1 Tax=Streptomyces sp. NPDC004111 TaxID=3364690 RepID=UPI0036B712CA
MTSTLFDLAFYCAAPFWLLMILAPRWHWTLRIVRSPLTVLPVLLVYLALALPVLPELWAAVRSPSLAGFQALMVMPDGAGAIWAQVIAWDLLLGQWMFLEARRLGLHPLLMGPLLVLTVLLSPIGLLIFLVLRAVRTARRRADGYRSTRPAGPADLHAKGAAG